MYFITVSRHKTPYATTSQEYRHGLLDVYDKGEGCTLQILIVIILSAVASTSEKSGICENSCGDYYQWRQRSNSSTAAVVVAVVIVEVVVVQFYNSTISSLFSQYKVQLVHSSPVVVVIVVVVVAVVVAAATATKKTSRKINENNAFERGKIVNG
ncbi:hypothetical protein ElyMa_004291700 [Elysia marginata]|uniref:Transmembrane protein n=1 Tax=Elysia marginata TaxID=1093978 RepID=A0AAV4GZ60_9GAST|nr:hypothetical protein ElyMa_004291700 [Elysia marginata]